MVCPVELTVSNGPDRTYLKGEQVNLLIGLKICSLSNICCYLYFNTSFLWDKAFFTWLVLMFLWKVKQPQHWISSEEQRFGSVRFCSVQKDLYCEINKSLEVFLIHL